MTAADRGDKWGHDMFEEINRPAPPEGQAEPEGSEENRTVNIFVSIACDLTHCILTELQILGAWSWI